jgi:hypothetical protein
MNKTKFLIAVIGVIGAGGLTWWKVSDTAMSRPERNVSASPASQSPGESAPAPAKAEWTSAPDWHDRLNKLIHGEGDTCDIEVRILAEEVALNDMRAALEHLVRSGIEERPLVDRLALLAFKRWADQAPSEAAQWLADLPAGGFNSTAHVYLGDTWAKADLDGALAWLKALPDSPDKKEVQLAIGSGAAEQKEVATALELLSVLPPDPRRDQALGYAVQVWAMNDRGSALEWLKGVQNPAWQEAAMGKIAVDWAITQPLEAAQFALDSIPPGLSQQNAVTVSVRNWAVQAPEQAAAWVERLSEGPLRHAAIESVAEVWAKENSIRAAEWLNSLPAGASRDKAVGMFALTLASTSPEKAAQWADKIQNETLRVSVRDQLKGQ